MLTNASYPWLSYDALKNACPDLIHLHITGRRGRLAGRGLRGKHRHRLPLTTGDDATASPVDHVLPAWDVACGLYAAIGILAAERHRRRTGAGRAITLSLADVALAVTGHLGFLAEGQLAAATRGDDPRTPQLSPGGTAFKHGGLPPPVPPGPRTPRRAGRGSATTCRWFRAGLPHEIG